MMKWRSGFSIVLVMICCPLFSQEKLRQITVIGPDPLPLNVLIRRPDSTLLNIISEVPDWKLESNRQKGTIAGGAGERKVFLSPGRQILTILAKGYLSVISPVVNLEAKKGYRLELKVKPIPGTIDIKTTPKGANIRWDGHLLKAKTPIRNDEVSPGSYHVQVMKEGYHSVEQMVTIKSNKVTKLEIALQQERYITRSLSLAFGIDLGYFQPIGTWANHRYANGVDLFGGSRTVRGEIEFRYKRMSISFNASYVNLNVGAWEDYALSNGSSVEATASLSELGGLLRFYLDKGKPNAFTIEFGMNYFKPRGEEKFAQEVYEYEFLKEGWGFVAGLGYYRYLSNRIALTFRVGGLILPSGVKYSDVVGRDLVGARITMGVRFET